MSGGQGVFITPQEIQDQNLARLAVLEGMITKSGGDIHTLELTLKCSNPKCDREVTVRRGDPEFDPSCDSMTFFKTPEQQPEKGWRCPARFGGCGGMMRIVT